MKLYKYIKVSERDVIMSYVKDTWSFLNSNEYEYKFAGRYGAKGEKRSKRKKATPEQIKKQNQSNKENRVRRLIKANFMKNDYWCCLKYKKGTRKSVDEYKKDLKKFLDDMRKVYKSIDEVFKFIYRIEVGAAGGVHIHILVNRIRGKTNTDILIQECWKNGRVNYESLYEAGGYKKLANYIVKPPRDDGEEEQLNLFEEERSTFLKYSTSRNLIRPEPERKKYSRWTMRKLMSEGPEPTLGYYIEKDSIVMGINPYTGMSYLKYTETRIKEIRPKLE